MTTAVAGQAHAPPPLPVAVTVVLSGRRRGSTVRLVGDELVIGSDPGAEIWLPAEVDRAVRPRHATVRLGPEGYELAPIDGADLWIDGERVVEPRLLRSGDLLEIGREGPVLRFRLYPPGTPASKSLAEIWADCRDCAVHGADGPVSKAAAVLAAAPRELATQTSGRFRAGVLAVLALFALWIFWTDRRSRRNLEAVRYIEGTEQLSGDDLRAIRAELESRLTSTSQRVEELEARGDRVARVIAVASRAVVFLQGSFGFVEPESGRPLRWAAEPGTGRVTLEGDGPPVESLYTGTAFVATGSDLLITNRHVARPWEFDDDAQRLVAQGLEARLLRFEGYLPGLDRAFPVEPVLASDEGDLAVLRCRGAATRVEPLAIDLGPATPGDEVVVLGYPTGIRALVARSDRALLDELLSGEPPGFWEIAQRLAAGGHIAPLASRGIVAQASASWVVYDAETTEGGSGGPVLGLDGRVVAITAAVLPDFGGSNLGVPAAVAARLLAEAEGLPEAGRTVVGESPPS